MATKINLRNFYPWYTKDEFVEVSDEVAAELLADKRYEQAYERQMYRYKAHYSLDVDNGIEAAVIVHSTDNPDAVLAMKTRHCRLCRALNSLSETQGRRIEAHYLLGMSITEIAAADGTGERNIRKSISRGLASMKIFLENSGQQGTEIQENCQC